jgi:hypothetical protein
VYDPQRVKAGANAFNCARRSAHVPPVKPNFRARWGSNYVQLTQSVWIPDQKQHPGTDQSHYQAEAKDDGCPAGDVSL